MDENGIHSNFFTEPVFLYQVNT